jgi:pseudouridine-5'-phosphate glycosidase/pseudouridine kinase
VAHNIAKASHLLGSFVRLHSAVGDDLSGRAAISQLQEEGMSVSGIETLSAPSRTAQYVAINNTNKDLALAMADMSILETIPDETIKQLATSIFNKTSPRPKAFVADANWSSSALHTWLQAARHQDTVTIFEPVSTAKALRIFPSIAPPSVYPKPLADIITPNTYELTALHDFAQQTSLFESPEWFSIIDALGIPNGGLRVPLAITVGGDLVDKGIPQQTIKLLPFFPTILTKLGPQGLLMAKLLAPGAKELRDDQERQYVLARNLSTDGEATVGGLYVRLFPVEKVLEPHEVVSVNGIGDTFCGALAHGLSQGKRAQDVIRFAQRAAGESLKSRQAVSPALRGLKM